MNTDNLQRRTGALLFLVLAAWVAIVVSDLRVRDLKQRVIELEQSIHKER